MAGQDTRVGDRQATAMRIKLKYPDVETFIQKYAVNISRGGIFIATKTPKPVGTLLRFEFVLANEAATSVIRGEGQVAWTREFDPSQPAKAHGMGVKFTRLDGESQAVVDRALAFRAQSTAAAGGVRDERADERQPPRSEERAEARREVPHGDERADDEERTDPAQPAGAQPVGRPPDEPTRPLPISPPESAPRAVDQVTRPISVESALADAGEDAATDARALVPDPTQPTLLPPVQPPLSDPRVKLSIERDPSREIRIRGATREAAAAELEAIAREWGVSDEQIERVLKRRRPRMVEATAELERLLRKPPKPPVPSKAEAMAGLRRLLERGSPVLEIDARGRHDDDAGDRAEAAGGASDPQPLKRAR